MSNLPFAVAAMSFELPLANCPPAETLAVVSVVAFSSFGASESNFGPSTSAAPSAGGVPMFEASARAALVQDRTRAAVAAYKCHRMRRGVSRSGDTDVEFRENRETAPRFVY